MFWGAIFKLFHTHKPLQGEACKSFWPVSLRPDTDSSPAPSLSSAAPLGTHLGVPQRAPVSQNIVMRMLIVYDRTRCTHQGFGAQNWLQIVISFDFHSPLNVSPELGLVSGLCSDHKHLWTVYIVFNVQISFAPALHSHIVLQFVIPSLEGDAFSRNLFKICTDVYMYVSAYIYVWVLLETREIQGET